MTAEFEINKPNKKAQSNPRDCHKRTKRMLRAERLRKRMMREHFGDALTVRGIEYGT